MSLRDIDPKIRAIAYPLKVNRHTRKISEQPDYDAYIIELIKQVIYTSPGERINRPDFGSGVRRMVFGGGAGGTDSFAKAIILEGLEKWLGDLISVEAVNTRFDNNVFYVEITYIVLHRGRRRYLNMEVTI